MDLSMKKSGYSREDQEADRQYSEGLLDSGKPIFIEVDEILSDNSIKGALLLPAFGAKSDTMVHVHQAPGTTHFDSISRHISGNQYVSGLRKGDIVSFDRVFLQNGDAYAKRLTSRTHDGMKGNVQFAIVNGRLGPSSISKFGALQVFTVVDGSSAYRIENIEDFKLAYERTAEKDWLGTAGVVLRLPNGMANHITIDKDTPLQAVIEEIEYKGYLSDSDDWFEFVPAWKLRVSRDQVARDVDLKTPVTRHIGHIGSWFSIPKSIYTGFQPCGIILCDEDEFKFGGKTGKVIRVAGGIQPISHMVAVDVRNIPSRARPELGPACDITTLFGDETLKSQMEDRLSRRPKEVSRQEPDHSSGGSFDDTDEGSVSPTIKKFW